MAIQKAGFSPTQVEIQQFAAIQAKQARGEQLNAEDRKVVGKFADAVVDTLDIPSNEALRQVMKKFLQNGELGASEQAQLREALGEIPALPHNQPLEAHLRELRAKGSATEADVEKIKTLTGKLSGPEDEAIYNTLASLAIVRGISEGAAVDISKWLDDGRVARGRYGIRQQGWAAAKRFGLIALTIVGLGATLALNPVLGAGATATALKTGVLFGAAFGSIKVADKWGESNRLNAQNYGVND